jgi:NACHT conflict system protein
MPDLTFDDVCQFIKEDQPDLIDQADTLLGFLLIISPLVFLPSTALVTPALGLLGVKNELTKLGKYVYSKLTGKKHGNNLTKARRMEIAYGLICFTAFFEEADAALVGVKESLGVDSYQRLVLAQVKSRFKKTGSRQDLKESLDQGFQKYPVSLPHPLLSFEVYCEQQLTLLKGLSSGLLSFVQELPPWNKLANPEQWQIIQTIDELPERALNNFRLQYVELAMKYEEFYVWANLHEHKETRAHVAQMSNYLQKQIELQEITSDLVDVGFGRLHKVIKALPKEARAAKANRVLEELARRYRHEIDKPIIGKTESTDDQEQKLIFPANADIFIPQSFKLILYQGKQRLEDESTWQSLESRNDLGSVLLKYLSSPYSASTPLIILGHPGSGKSLLSKMLAARFFSPLYTPFLVNLRDIEADNDIVLQIEEQIRVDAREASWASLSDQLSQHPPLVILDGYDELLQASGKVFSGYLMKVQKFQESEQAIRQRVRCIVTSRITLIDKAQVPRNSVIIRLEEFDEGKKEKWTSIWNGANNRYFSENQTQPFKVPSRNLKISSLASQPLLLLMLALYDSDGNRLHKEGNLDQTILYHSLIHRFVKRERMKSVEFRALKTKELESEIDKDIERLGVAAIGMFNRRSLQIRSSQLNDDLAFFRLEKEIPESSGRKLSQADAVLGSFFFVYRSKSSYRAEPSQEYETESAFEFLHNTFGEFLTADFILRRLFAETQSLFKLRHDSDLLSELDRKLNDPNGFSASWFTSLMYTPLYTRPVVLEMLSEWLTHKLTAFKGTKANFLEEFDLVISNQINRLLNTTSFPTWMIEGGKTPFGNLPVIAYVAIYTVNLVTIRTIFSDEEYCFEDNARQSHDERAEIWTRLTHLWRSWFSIESLGGITAVMTGRRDKQKVLLRRRKSFALPPRTDRLDSILNISLAVGDETTAGIVGLALFDPYGVNTMDLFEVEHKLNAERLDLTLEIALRKLRFLYGSALSKEEQHRLFGEYFRLLANSKWSNFGILIDLMLLMREIGVKRYYSEFANEFFRRVDLEYMLSTSPQTALALFRLADKHDSPTVAVEYSKEFFKHIFKSDYLSQTHPKVAAETFRMARIVRSEEYLKNDAKGFLDRVLARRFSGIPVEVALQIIRFALPDETRFTRLYQLYLDEVISPKSLLGYAPEISVQVLKFAAEIGDQKYFYKYASEFLLKLPQKYLLAMPIEVAKEAVEVALQVENWNLVRPFFEVLPVYIRNSLHWKQASAQELLEMANLFRTIRDPAVVDRLMVEI